MKTKTKTKTKITPKTLNKHTPLTRKEFRDAISMLPHAELVGILCDIYYPKANENGGCGCDCGCASEPKKPSKAPKAKVSKSKKQ